MRDAAGPELAARIDRLRDSLTGESAPAGDHCGVRCVSSRLNVESARPANIAARPSMNEKNSCGPSRLAARSRSASAL